MTDRPLYVLYIAGNGRSGSTLLDMLLGSFDEAWSLGELHAVPWELKERKEGCECGQDSSICPFWSRVQLRAGDILRPGGNLCLFRETLSNASTVRPREIHRLFFHRPFPQSELDHFCRDNRRFFEIAREEAERIRDCEINYLIDASKDPYRLFWLVFCEGINVKIIHLKKDPRAYVYSMTKKAKRPEAAIGRATRASARYVVENLLVETILKRVPASEHFSLRYEDLAMDPESTLRDIGRWLNLPYEEGRVARFRQIERHGLTGNQARHERKGVALDDAWKRKLPRLHKTIAYCLTRSWATRYGYFS